MDQYPILKYPLIINSEDELIHFCDVFLQRSVEPLMSQYLDEMGLLNPYITVAHAGRMWTPRRVEKAIAAGKLKYVIRGKLRMVLRERVKFLRNQDDYSIEPLKT